MTWAVATGRGNYSMTVILPVARLVAAPTTEFDPFCDSDGKVAVCVWTDTRTGEPLPHGRESVDGGQSWGPRFELDP